MKQAALILLPWVFLLGCVVVGGMLSIFSDADERGGE